MLEMLSSAAEEAGAEVGSMALVLLVAAELLATQTIQPQANTELG